MIIIYRPTLKAWGFVTEMCEVQDLVKQTVASLKSLPTRCLAV